MLMIGQRLQETRAADDSIVLPFGLRSRSRFRARLSSGEDVGVVLARGQVLRGGDLLQAADGRVIQVLAALELVTSLRADHPNLLARAAFHLGNRHVALQIGDGWLRYLHDHVLDEMARRMGLRVTVEEAAFEPEAGAYHTHAAAESPHDHDGDQSQDHSHHPREA